MTFRQCGNPSDSVCNVLSKEPALHVLRSHKILLSQMWEKVLILSALQKHPMNAKCDSNVLLYTYKVAHVFALCCFCSIPAGQYYCSLCLWRSLSLMVTETSFFPLMTLMKNAQYYHLNKYLDKPRFHQSVRFSSGCYILQVIFAFPWSKVVIMFDEHFQSFLFVW